MSMPPQQPGCRSALVLDATKDRADALLELLEPWQAQLKPFASCEDTAPEQEALPMSRRLTLAAQNALDPKQLSDVEAVLAQEQVLADRLNVALGDRAEDPEGATRQTALHRCAIRELLNRLVIHHVPHVRHLMIDALTDRSR